MDRRLTPVESSAASDGMTDHEPQPPTHIAVEHAIVEVWRCTACGAARHLVQLEVSPGGPEAWANYHGACTATARERLAPHRVIANDETVMAALPTAEAAETPASGAATITATQLDAGHAPPGDLNCGMAPDDPPDPTT